jgi:hypothetical protein
VRKEKHRFFFWCTHRRCIYFQNTALCKKHRIIFYTAQYNVHYSDFVVVRCGAVHFVNAFYTALHTLLLSKIYILYIHTDFCVNLIYTWNLCETRNCPGISRLIISDTHAILAKHYLQIFLIIIVVLLS